MPKVSMKGMKSAKIRKGASKPMMETGTGKPMKKSGRKMRKKR